MNESTHIPEPLLAAEEEFQNPEQGSQTAQLPDDKALPPVIRELVTNAPEKFKMATFIASVAPLGCLATRLRFYYPFDQGPMACLLQTIICSEQSGGKSFARNVENVIMAKQKQRDNEQRRQEQAYRELKQTASKTEKLPDPPKTMVICCPVSISIAQLIKRADSPVRLFGTPLTLWTFTEELATATETNRRAFSNIKSIMRTAYDLGAEYGVDYLSDASYSATVDILYNTMFCTTPSALDEYMDRKAIEGGNITRTIERMMADTYSPEGGIQPEKWIDMSWLDEEVRQWCATKNLEAVKTGSTALGVFFKRSSVSAFRIAALCQYLYGIEQAHGVRRKVRQIYLAMAEQILRGMLEKWGKRFEELQAKRIELSTPVRRDLFGNLPAAFSRELLRETIKRLELVTPDWVFLSKWNARGLIQRISKNQFQKIGQP